MNRHYARQRPPEYFRWQYFETPLAAVSFGAFDGDCLVGHFGLQRKPMSPSGMIDQVMDIIIESDYRGGDLFFHLWEQARLAIGLSSPAMVLANPSGKRACLRSLGFLEVAEIESFVLRREELVLAHRPSEPKLRRRLVWERESFDWRFRRHPLFDYQIHQGEGAAVVVGKLFRSETQCQGDIVYFEGLPDSGLWTKACLGLFEHGAEQINCWAFPNTEEREVMMALGFQLDSPQNRYFCVKSDDAELLRAERWSLASADTEHF